MQDHLYFVPTISYTIQFKPTNKQSHMQFNKKISVTKQQKIHFPFSFWGNKQVGFEDHSWQVPLTR